MAWWLPWQRVAFSSSMPAEEVQRRVAASTAEWNVAGWGTPAPPPPWADGAFVAVRGGPGLSAWAVVVTGTVRPDGSGSRLEARIRAHGIALAGTAVFVLAAAVLLSDSGAVGRFVLPLLAIGAYLMLVGFSREPIRRVAAILEDACRAPVPEAGRGAPG